MTDKPCPPTDSLTLSDAETPLDDHGGAFQRNKAALLDALAAHGITHVTVTFDGYGDSGQVEGIEAKAAIETVPLPPVLVEVADRGPGAPDLRRRPMPLTEAVEHLAYDVLGMSHLGWEDNDGGFGDVLIDVARRTVLLDFNQRYTASRHFAHAF